jgi:AcrR family transcriptional regulator
VVIEIDASTSNESAPTRTSGPGGRAAGAIDGRHARSERSRQAMVDALLDLLREGTLRPSSAQIAERAGVTQRTLFNQFGDMDSLVAAVAASQVRRVLAMLPDAGTGSLEQRVDAYSAGLALLLEETMHVRWAVVTNTVGNETSARALQTAREFMRTHVAQAFAPELDALDDTTKHEVLDALEPLSDPAAWRLRRVQQGLSVDDAARVVRRTLLALVRDAAR